MKRYLLIATTCLAVGSLQAQVKLDMNYGDRTSKNVVTISDLTSSKVIVSSSADTAFDKTVALADEQFSFLDASGYSGNLRIEFSCWGDDSFTLPNWGGEKATLAFSGNGWGVIDSSTGQMINNDEAIVFTFDFSSMTSGRNPVILDSLELGMGKDFEIWKKAKNATQGEMVASGKTQEDGQAKVNARVRSGDSFALVMPNSPGRLRYMTLDIKRHIPTIVKTQEVPEEVVQEAPKQPEVQTPTPTVTAPKVSIAPKAIEPTVVKGSTEKTAMSFNLTGLVTVLLLPLLRKED